MSLSDAQRARFARHLLLPEIGDQGQLRLASSRVRAQADADAGALGVARDYLQRAGVSVLSPDAGSDASQLPLASREALDQLAGRPELLEAARALAGAFAAVESIKNIVGIGTPSELPSSFSLASEEA